MKKTQGEENIRIGEIGYNVPPGEEEKEEDLLETLYLWWRQNRPLTVIDLVIETGMKKREVNALLRKMTKHGYIAEPDGGTELRLTDFGKGRGAECMARHEKLVQFLQMVSGMDAEEAGEDACRLEHVISKRAFQGISDFLKYGDIYDRIIRNPDFLSMYGEGRREMCMAIYYAEKRQPRILAEEFEQFEDLLTLDVEKGGAFFELRLADKETQRVLWYQKEDAWEQAERTEEGYRIPARVFSCMISASVPVMEGMAMIALLDENQKPTAIDCRELTIHLW